ncbi:MAG TPA: DUF1501 domain-containing protein, partial [Planctomycetaceae bacterium]|nr:DUF1501 domain-containing protein [Planctomycetaceae bacterium]
SWLTYGLGSQSQNLPGYVVISPKSVFQGAPLWGCSFLPGAYQATWIQNLDQPISNLTPAGGLVQQRRQLDVLRALNQIHQQRLIENDAMEARIASFELAFRMQTEAPEAFELTSETSATLDSYGIGR